MDIKLSIIAYVPTLYTNIKMVANKIEKAFTDASKKYNVNIKCEKTIECNKELISSKLKEIALYLEKSNCKAIVYYYGYENDEISHIFNKINDNSYLYLFSDTCSPNSILDIYYDKRNWVTISSASIDGSIFTLCGLIPSLEQIQNHTPENIYNFIRSNIDIPIETCMMHIGENNDIINKNIFI